MSKEVEGLKNKSPKKEVEEGEAAEDHQKRRQRCSCTNVCRVNGAVFKAGDLSDVNSWPKVNPFPKTDGAKTL